MNVVGITSLQPKLPAQSELPAVAGTSVGEVPSGDHSAPLVSASLKTPGTGATSVPQGDVKSSYGADLQKNIDKLNRVLAAYNTKVEMDSRAPANDIWLNLVDQTTGQVLQRFPPEGLREFLLSEKPKGFALDTQL